MQQPRRCYSIPLIPLLFFSNRTSTLRNIHNARVFFCDFGLNITYMCTYQVLVSYIGLRRHADVKYRFLFRKAFTCLNYYYQRSSKYKIRLATICEWVGVNKTKLYRLLKLLLTKGKKAIWRIRERNLNRTSAKYLRCKFIHSFMYADLADIYFTLLHTRIFFLHYLR